MPASNIASIYNKSVREIGILNNFILGSTILQSQHQYLIAEVVMLRLFGIFESIVAEVAFRLACNAKYRNGSRPIVLRSCRSVQDANAQMLSLGRRNPLRYLKWTTDAYIKDSIKFVLDINDSFYANIYKHSSSLNEMRIVRNQIAHRTASTKRQFDQVLITRYGANPRLSMGAFLTSTLRHPVSNISRYLATMRIILSEITNG